MNGSNNGGLRVLEPLIGVAPARGQWNRQHDWMPENVLRNNRCCDGETATEREPGAPSARSPCAARTCSFPMPAIGPSSRVGVIPERAVTTSRASRGSRERTAMIERIASDFGLHPMTLRKWLRRADIGAGAKPGLIRTESAELREARARIRLWRTPPGRTGCTRTGVSSFTLVQDSVRVPS